MKNIDIEKILFGRVSDKATKIIVVAALAFIVVYAIIGIIL